MPVCLACSVKSVDQVGGGATTAGRGTDGAQRLSCHSAPGAPVNTVGAIAASSPNASGRQRLRTEDQVGFCGGDAGGVGLGAGADRGHIVDRRCRGTTAAWPGRTAVGRRRGHDARLQAQRAQRVELIAGEHHDALWIGRDVDVTAVGSAVDAAGRLAGIQPRGFGRTGVVRPALIAQHTRAGDLGGAGDDAAGGRDGRLALRPAAAGGQRHRHGRDNGRRGGEDTGSSQGREHGPDGNTDVFGSGRPDIW